MRTISHLSLLAALVLAVTPAHATTALPHLARVPPAEVHAGDVVDVAWTTAGPDVAELELLLSLDGGAHWTIRLTPELDGRTTRWRWRVPELASEHARLRLRCGGDTSEAWGEASAEFRIVARGVAQHARAPWPVWLGADAGARGWWDESQPMLPAPLRAGLQGDAAHFAAAAAAAACTAPQRTCVCPPPAPAVAWIAPVARLAEPARAPDVPNAPRVLPLRE